MPNPMVSRDTSPQNVAPRTQPIPLEDPLNLSIRQQPHDARTKMTTHTHMEVDVPDGSSQTTPAAPTNPNVALSSIHK